MDMKEFFLNQLITRAREEFTLLNVAETLLDEMSEVQVSPELMSLIYVPCKVFANERNYYFVQDNKVIFMGYIDKEGLLGTIGKDVSTLPELVNFVIALRIGDKEKLEQMLSDLNTLLAIIEQNMIGRAYYEESHGKVAGPLN